MGKTHIGELFFRERALKLPTPLSRRYPLKISERALRLLITCLIILFLLSLGISLFLQLMQSRTAHLFEQNRVTALDADVAALAISAAYATAQAEGRTAPVMSDQQSRRFARPRLGDAQQIAPGHDVRNGLRLNRRRRDIIFFGKSAQNGGAEAELSELRQDRSF